MSASSMIVTPLGNIITWLKISKTLSVLTLFFCLFPTGNNSRAIVTKLHVQVGPSPGKND